MLLGVRRKIVRLAGIRDQKIRRQREPALGGVDHMADVTETILIGVGRNAGLSRGRSGVSKSAAREGCTLSIRIIGVGCGHS